MTQRKQKRRSPSPKEETGSQLRADVEAAIVSAWPEGEIGIPFDLEESWFWDVHETLTGAFHSLAGSRLLQESEGEPKSDWTDSDDDDDDIPFSELTRSYHIFFIGPDDDAFEFDTHTENEVEPDFDEYGEDWDGEFETVTVEGKGYTGWSVAVSMIVPFAVITLSTCSIFEDGSFSRPAIERCAEDEDGNVIVNLEDDFRKSHGELLFQKLDSLRTRIAAILEKRRITVLPETEWRKLVPELVSNGDAVVGDAIGQPIRVLDAFFFESL